ncbi:MAG: hypothetical protein R2788_12820 [Saprospiraceae bacterium]
MLLIDREAFKYVPESINAGCSQQLKGFRTQFLSFHHLLYEDAKQILQNAVDAKMPIAIFEIQERNSGNYVLKNMFSPIMVLLTAPFIRPFSIGRLVFTYLIPIVPFFILWDGVVSVLRTYTLDEMKQMTTELKTCTHFKWEIEKIKDGPITVIYLLGYPK